MLNKYELIHPEQLKKYAELAVKVSVNVQKGQLMIITCPVEDYEFGRLVQTMAYDAGASQVIIEWEDDLSKKEFYLKASDDAIDDYPDWQVEKYRTWDEAGACYLHIETEYPDLFKDVPQERMSRHARHMRAKLAEHYAKYKSYETRWALLYVPSEAWATKMFENLSLEEALRQSWQQIIHASRAKGENPVSDWQEHGESFKDLIKFLDETQFESFHFKNSLGTDLTVGLVKNHRFIGGACHGSNGIDFYPNIPTEEVFTNPHKYRVNGKLVASKPFIYAGNVIENVVLEFENGKIIHHDASAGLDALTSFLDTDEGTRYLGEIALVSANSPLAKGGHVFYSTMFDENTGCHVGIGASNPSCMQNPEEINADDFDRIGLNESCMLINMTIGTKDMTVTGITASGQSLVVMEAGNYVF